MNTATAEKQNKIMYISQAENFSKIPGSPIAYWVSKNIFNIFDVGDDISLYIDSFQGIITGNNDKFLRLWYELSFIKIALDYDQMHCVDLKKTYWMEFL